ncbi:hypothetical protein P5673_026545 [Acropora cervicornis]|uniref:Uncharacterized protein n=1 Tax=Acropora cervicornis TaxID=6130 RepID=A0AAD9Q0E7_ACRCE|nr:hypothetical protein P5673_026545 [Acropora cervicornis]
MFYQVYVAQEYRDLLRFLSGENENFSKDSIECRMIMHIFSAISFPGCSNFALKKTAQENECELGSAAADFLRNDFYVDDGFKTCTTIEGANHLIKSVKEMCRRGGFNLEKFVSNKKEVIKNIPMIDRTDDLKSINIDLDNSIFDPLGFIAPVLLEGKCILQDLCRNGVDWDDSIIPEHFSIPRCFKPDDFRTVVKKELHQFSDASTKGYGQCSYLRLKDDSGRIHCAFVAGKSLPAIVMDGSKSFPGCSLVRIVSSTTPGSVSLVHGFTHDKSIPYLFLTPQARSQKQTENLIHLLKKLAPGNDIRGWLYLVDPM